MINSPGAPTNPPQHLVGEGPEVGEAAPPIQPDRARQTGPGTAPPGAPDVADPHPSDEGHPYRPRHPGGAHPPAETKDIGPNPAKHTGTAPPRPHNAGSGPE